MIKEGKFGVHETVCLLTIAVCNKIYFTAPGYVNRAVGSAAWYMTLVSAVVAIIMFTFIYLLLKRFPGKDLVEIYSRSMGRVAGFIFSFILMLTLLGYSSIFTREFSDVVKIYNYPNTPSSILMGAILAASAVAVYLGLETIARTAKLAAYFALFGLLLILVLASQYFKFAHILPILGYGIRETVITGVMRTSAYAEVTILAVFAGALQGSGHIRKAGYITLFISGIVLSLALLCYSMIFEYTSTTELSAPMYVMATLIKYGDFLQRLDPVFLVNWVITTVIYISFLLYSAISVYCKLFRIQDKKPVVIPMTVLAFTLAILPQDFTSVVTKYIQGIRIWANIPFFLFPFIALLVSLVRRKRGDINV